MRVVAHSCSNTEIVCALGCADLLVGVDDHSDHPADVVARLPRIGPDLHTDVERVVALRPDLVVASLTVPGHERNIEAMQRAGLPVLVVEPLSLDDVYRDVRVIAAALGVPERGEALAAELRAELDAPPPSLPYRPAVLVEWWPKPVIVPGRRSWVHDLIDRAGGRNVLGDRDVASSPVTDAEVVAMAPDAVVIAWCGVPEHKYRPEVVLRRPGWRDVPAVRDRRVVSIHEAYLGRPGPRLVDGLRALRRVVTNCVAERMHNPG